MELNKTNNALVLLQRKIFDVPNQIYLMKHFRPLNQNSVGDIGSYIQFQTLKLLGSGQCCFKEDRRECQKNQNVGAKSSNNGILDKMETGDQQHHPKNSLSQLAEQQIETAPNTDRSVGKTETVQNQKEHVDEKNEFSPEAIREKIRQKIDQAEGKDIYKIIGNKYALRGRLGQGAWGNVYLATYSQLDNPLTLFAVKEMPLNSGPAHRIIREMLTNREIKNMTRVHHENIVALHDFLQTQNNTYLVMEYCEGGNLKDYLNRNKNKITEANAQALMKDLAEGLKALFESKVLHRDLKPENLLLTGKNNKLKICDLGFSKNVQEESEGKTKCGTNQYMAHEILKGGGKYTYKVDLWSTGIILYQLLSGELPYKYKSDYQIMVYQLIGPNLSKINCSDLCKDFVFRLLQCRENKRFNFDEFYNHQWLRTQCKQGESTAKVQKSPQDLNQQEIQEIKQKIEQSLSKVKKIFNENVKIEDPKLNNEKASELLFSCLILKKVQDEYSSYLNIKEIRECSQFIDSLLDTIGFNFVAIKNENESQNVQTKVINFQEIVSSLNRKYSEIIKEQGIDIKQIQHIVEEALSFIGTMSETLDQEQWCPVEYWMTQEEVQSMGQSGLQQQHRVSETEWE